MRACSSKASWAILSCLVATSTLSSLNFSEALAATGCDKLQKKYKIAAVDMKLVGCDTAAVTVAAPTPGKAADPATAILHPEKTAPAAPTVAAATPPAKPALPAGWSFLLRQNWSDIGVLGAPTAVDKATGATASFSNDLVAANRAWAVDGTAAVVYSGFNEQGPSQTGPFHQGFAAYASVNKLYNSNP